MKPIFDRRRTLSLLFKIILHYKYTIYSIDWKYKKSHDYNLIFFKNMSEKYCFEIFKKNLNQRQLIGTSGHHTGIEQT